MPVTHTSAHHSPDDPGGLIREAFNMGADFPGPAQDVLLSWLLSLGDGADPALAARALLTAYGIESSSQLTGAGAELADLLRQAAETDTTGLTARRRRSKNRRRQDQD